MIFFKTLIAFLMSPLVWFWRFWAKDSDETRWFGLIINGIGLSINLGCNVEFLDVPIFGGLLMACIAYQVTSLTFITAIISHNTWKKTKEEVITREAQKGDPKSGGITEC